MGRAVGDGGEASDRDLSLAELKFKNRFQRPRSNGSLAECDEDAGQGVGMRILRGQVNITQYL